jgi:anti-sigma B factor antagonist
MSNPSLSIAESHSGQVCVMALAGRIDSTNAEELMARLKGALSSGAKTVLVDFTDVIYLTSAAFRTLLVATDEAERNTARFALCGVLGQVRELFEMGGLLEAFTIHASRAEALERLA